MSVSVVRSAFSCVRVPLIVSVVPPFDGVIVPPPPVAAVVADSTPLVSVSTAVNVSPLVVVLPVSDDADPADRGRLALLHRRRAGAAIDGTPFTVTAIATAAVAVPPLLSLTLIVIMSAAVEASLSVSVVRSAFSCARVPLMRQRRAAVRWRDRAAAAVAVVVADSTPLVSVSTAVNVSPAVVGGLRDADPADRAGLTKAHCRRPRRCDRRQTGLRRHRLRDALRRSCVAETVFGIDRDRIRPPWKRRCRSASSDRRSAAPGCR